MKNIGAERQLSEYNHVYKENTAIYRDLSVRMGMTESTFWILYTLRVEEAPVTQSDMCAILGYPKQTVNSALKKLEQEGLLTLSGGRGRGGLGPDGAGEAAHDFVRNLPDLLFRQCHVRSLTDARPIGPAVVISRVPARRPSPRPRRGPGGSGWRRAHSG